MPSIELERRIVSREREGRSSRPQERGKRIQKTQEERKKLNFAESKEIRKRWNENLRNPRRGGSESICRVHPTKRIAREMRSQ